MTDIRSRRPQLYSCSHPTPQRTFSPGPLFALRIFEDTVTVFNNPEMRIRKFEIGIPELKATDAYVHSLKKHPQIYFAKVEATRILAVYRSATSKLLEPNLTTLFLVLSRGYFFPSQWTTLH